MRTSAVTVPRAWVLLHGTPLDPAVWDDLSPILARQQPVYAPIATPAVDEAEPQMAIAERLAAELAPLADRWDVVGHSFGGQIALDLALLAPGRVASLAILCSRDTPFGPFAQTAAALRSGVPIDVDAALDRWFRPAERQSGERLVTYAREQLVNADRGTWATALDAIASYDRSAAVPQIHAPTLVLGAALDPVSDPATMTALAGRLPQARLEIVDGAAHLSPLLRPAWLAERLSLQLG
jgi:pimeloyl-ACP methyl ester carboxylesterase